MKVVLMMGGISAEREVSLTSGAQVLSALEARGHEVQVIDPREQPGWLGDIANDRPDVVFNILHGGAGENGELRAVLNNLGIPCTGSDTLGSAVAMDKPLSKQIWQTLGIPVPKGMTAQSGADAPAIVEQLGESLFVKPAGGGSSTNSAPVTRAADLAGAIDAAASETGMALVEQHIDGIEYTLSIVNDQPLPLIKIEPASTFYDYHAKYISEQTRFTCPCQLPPEQEAALADTAMRAFRALRCSSWGRVDMMLTAGNDAYFLEVNTVPGMTSHSLVPLAAKTRGIDFETLVDMILRSAL